MVKEEAAKEANDLASISTKKIPFVKVIYLQNNKTKVARRST